MEALGSQKAIPGSFPMRDQKPPDRLNPGRSEESRCRPLNLEDKSGNSGKRAKHFQKT